MNTGRPRDDFVWQHVKKLSHGWKCIYCNRSFKGSATRIRNHLTGQRNGISPCEFVPKEIAEELLKRSTPNPLQDPSSSFLNQIGMSLVQEREMMSNNNNNSLGVTAHMNSAGFIIGSERTVINQLMTTSATPGVEPAGSANVSLGWIDDIVSTPIDATAEDPAIKDTNNRLAMTPFSLSAELNKSNDSGSVRSSALRKYESDLRRYISLPSATPAAEESVTQSIRNTSVDALAVISVSYSSTRAVADHHVGKSVGALAVINHGGESVAQSIRNTSVDALAVINVYSSSTDHHGEDESANQKSSSVGIEEHMTMVTESWKTTGYTVMLFNLAEHGGDAVALYCPKGLIFVKEITHLQRVEFDEDVNVMHVIYHGYEGGSLGGAPFCKSVSDRSSIPCAEKVAALNHISFSMFQCVRHEIHVKCIDICKTSKWVQRLWKKSDSLYEILVHPSTCDLYFKYLKGSGFINGFAAGKHATPITRFLSVMPLRSKLERIVSDKLCRNRSHARKELKAILDDSKFWKDGRKLRQALDPILKIPGLMDTLIPTAGYLAMAMDKAKKIIFKGRRPKEQADPFWHALYEYLTCPSNNIRSVAYLNPVYFLRKKRRDPLKHNLQLMLASSVREEDRQEIVEQLQRYSEECNSLFGHIDHIHKYHPVTLWEEHGRDLPLLRKYAIMMLSQPVTCLCNKVKKGIRGLEGGQGYIQRLNVRMMEEFRELGDDIYKPINVNRLQKKV